MSLMTVTETRLAAADIGIEINDTIEELTNDAGLLRCSESRGRSSAHASGIMKYIYIYVCMYIYCMYAVIVVIPVALAHQRVVTMCVDDDEMIDEEEAGRGRHTSRVSNLLPKT